MYMFYFIRMTKKCAQINQLSYFCKTVNLLSSQIKNTHHDSYVEVIKTKVNKRLKELDYDQ